MAKLSNEELQKLCTELKAQDVEMWRELHILTILVCCVALSTLILGVALWLN